MVFVLIQFLLAVLGRCALGLLELFGLLNFDIAWTIFPLLFAIGIVVWLLWLRADRRAQTRAEKKDIHS